MFKDCFSDNDMFFGGGKYEYSWKKHMGVASEKKYRNEEKLKIYKNYDGIKFIYKDDSPTPMVRVSLSNGETPGISREWCNKIDAQIIEKTSEVY